jgi:hypothetical protein
MTETPIPPIGSHEHHMLLMSCRDAIRKGLIAQQKHRAIDPDWINSERDAIARAANMWAMDRHWKRRINTADVEEIEHRAVGHVDYTDKISLYAAELLLAQPNWAEVER